MRNIGWSQQTDTPTDILVQSLGYVDYDHYLRGRHWRTFCEAVRTSRCWCCDKQPGHLHVHHITYARFGYEDPTDVITVCQGCHHAIHVLSRKGTPLEKAHVSYRRILVRRGTRPKRRRWVSWFRLLNTSKHQTVGDLRLFLEEHGLLEGASATPKAFELGFVRLEDGKQRWNLKKYLGFVSAWKSIEKRREQGRGISRTVARLASGR